MDSGTSKFWRQVGGLFLGFIVSLLGGFFFISFFSCLLVTILGFLVLFCFGLFLFGFVGIGGGILLAGKFANLRVLIFSETSLLGVNETSGDITLVLASILLIDEESMLIHLLSGLDRLSSLNSVFGLLISGVVVIERSIDFLGKFGFLLRIIGRWHFSANEFLGSLNTFISFNDMLVKNNSLGFHTSLFKFKSLLGSEIERINLRWAKGSIDRVGFSSLLNKSDADGGEMNLMGNGYLQKLFGIKEVFFVEVQSVVLSEGILHHSFILEVNMFTSLLFSLLNRLQSHFVLILIDRGPSLSGTE